MDEFNPFGKKVASAIYGVQFLPGEKYVLLQMSDGLCIVDIASGQIVFKKDLEFKDGVVASDSVMSDHSFLWLTRDDKAAVLTWDQGVFALKEYDVRFKGKKDSEFSAKFAAKAPVFFSVNEERNRVWVFRFDGSRIRKVKDISIFSIPQLSALVPLGAYSLEITPDGKYLIYLRLRSNQLPGSQKVQIFDLENGNKIHDFIIPVQSELRNPMMSPDGKKLYLERDSTLIQIDLEKAQLLKSSESGLE